MRRRLSAIIAADMVGFSRLMAADENGTIARQKAHRSALIDPKIAQFGGRIVKTTGDGLLIEFPSSVDAVQCAVEIQETMSEREREVSEENRIQYRIGINLGDIVIDGDDILGDGVNLAARLEGIAEPGSICISDVVYQNLQGKLAEAFSDPGRPKLKNIPREILVWRWSAAVREKTGAKKPTPSLKLPDKPSVAVLPFTNMSGDSEQDYFADGITEDIITELSRFRALFVIARNSSFVFKGQALDLAEVGAKLGVGYLVEGSVRRANERVRVTAQLIEVESGAHVWAERYDRDLEDVFQVQDEVVRSITAALAERVSNFEAERLSRRAVPDLQAYDLILRAHARIAMWTGEHYREAQSLLIRAIELDPQCAQAYGSLAWCKAFLAWFEGETLTPIKEAIDLGKQALELDQRILEAHTGLGWAYLLSGKGKTALRHFEMATQLNPNSATAKLHLGYCKVVQGDPKGGLEDMEMAMRLNPLCPDWYYESLGEGLYMIGDYEGALDAFRRMNQMAAWTHGYIAATYAQLGQMEEAEVELEKFRCGISNDHTAEYYILELDLPMYGDPKVRDRWLEGYRKVGLKV